MYAFRSANLILNLFSLMVDANVPDIALEPDKTVKKVSQSSSGLFQGQLGTVCNDFTQADCTQLPLLLVEAGKEN